MPLKISTLVSAMKLEEGKTILVNTIKFALRHCDYERVKTIAKKYRALTTGEEIDFLLKQFAPRENDVMFAQRKALTEVITPDIISSLMKPMYKVGSASSHLDIRWEKNDGAEEKRKAVMTAVNKYKGEQSVMEYFETRLPQLDTTDPNSFIVTELEGKLDPNNPNATKLSPYPFEVSSEAAINYNYKNGILDWLIVLCGETMYAEGDTKVSDGERYTMYLDNESIVAQEIHKDVIIRDEEAYIKENGATEILTIDYDDNKTAPSGYGKESKKDGTKNKRRFLVTVFEHKGGQVPAFRIGVNLDLHTEGRTTVPLIHASMSYLLKSVKTISEFDLTNSLHVFPQKIQYVRPCTGTSEEPCNDGHTAAGEKCGVCKGMGYDPAHASAQDMLTIKLPRDPKEMVSLENILVYKHPPIDLLKFQQELGLVVLREKAQQAVYNSDIFAKAKFSDTATAANIDLDSVHDTLLPFSKGFQSATKKTITLVATYIDQGAGIHVAYKIPKNLTAKSLTQLMSELKQANDSGAPSFVKMELTMDIAKQTYVDRPREIKKLETKNTFFPFPGKSDAQIQYIIGQKLTTRENAILWAEFDSIFHQLEQQFANGTTQIDFYDLAPRNQANAIKVKVADIITAQDEETANQAAIQFNGQETVIEGQPVDGEGNAAPAIDKVSDAGMNGAQVSALLDICKQVTEGNPPLPIESAQAIIAAAFPAVKKETIEAIVGPLENLKPKPTEPVKVNPIP